KDKALLHLPEGGVRGVVRGILERDIDASLVDIGVRLDEEYRRNRPDRLSWAEIAGNKSKFPGKYNAFSKMVRDVRRPLKVIRAGKRGETYSVIPTKRHRS